MEKTVLEVCAIEGDDADPRKFKTPQGALCYAMHHNICPVIIHITPGNYYSIEATYSKSKLPDYISSYLEYIDTEYVLSIPGVLPTFKSFRVQDKLHSAIEIAADPGAVLQMNGTGGIHISGGANVAARGLVFRSYNSGVHAAVVVHSHSSLLIMDSNLEGNNRCSIGMLAETHSHIEAYRCHIENFTNYGISAQVNSSVQLTVDRDTILPINGLHKGTEHYPRAFAWKNSYIELNGAKAKVEGIVRAQQGSHIHIGTTHQHKYLDVSDAIIQAFASTASLQYTQGTPKTKLNTGQISDYRCIDYNPSRSFTWGMQAFQSYADAISSMDIPEDVVGAGENTNYSHSEQVSERFKDEEEQDPPTQELPKTDPKPIGVVADVPPGTPLVFHNCEITTNNEVTSVKVGPAKQKAGTKKKTTVDNKNEPDFSNVPDPPTSMHIQGRVPDDQVIVDYIPIEMQTTIEALRRDLDESDLQSKRYKDSLSKSLDANTSLHGKLSDLLGLLRRCDLMLRSRMVPRNDPENKTLLHDLLVDISTALNGPPVSNSSSPEKSEEASDES